MRRALDCDCPVLFGFLEDCGIVRGHNHAVADPLAVTDCKLKQCLAGRELKQVLGDDALTVAASRDKHVDATHRRASTPQGLHIVYRCPARV